MRCITAISNHFLWERSMNRFLSTLLLLLTFAAPAYAQGSGSGSGAWGRVAQTWWPQANASLAASAVSSNVALGAGSSAKVCNSGANDVYVLFGTANTVVATTASGWLIKAGGACEVFDLKPFSTQQTYMAAITGASTSTVLIVTGLGSPQGLGIPVVVVGGTANNASVGTNGAAIPTSSTLIGSKDGSGNLQPAAPATPIPTSDLTTQQLIATYAVPVPLGITGVIGSDGSQTLTTANSAQNLFSGATPTNSFEVCNPDVSHDLWISLSTTALANDTGSIRVPMNGGCYSPPPGFRPFHAISAVGSLNSQKVEAIKW